jgi:predicted PurR-regulated permease PerM
MEESVKNRISRAQAATVDDAPPQPLFTGRKGEARANILFAFALALALLLGYVMRQILLMLYVSALFAVVLTPVIQAIMQVKTRFWKPGRGTAIILLLVLVGGAVTLFFAVALPPVVRDLSTFTKELPSRGPQMLGQLRRVPFASHLDVAALNARVQSYASNIVEYVLLSVSKWASQAVDIATVVVLTVYFMLEGDTAYHWALSLFPREIRGRLDDTLLRAEVRMGRWLLGQGLLMLILGISSTIAFVLLKIRYAYALGVIMGVLNIIPIVGALVSMALVLLVAAVDSWTKVLGALIFYVIYAQVETSYLTPRIMQNRVNLPGLAILVALLMGSKLAGVVGAMVSVPTAVLVAVLVQEYLVKNGETKNVGTSHA